MWVVGELGPPAVVGSSEWNEGFEVTATLNNASGATVATAHLTVARDVRTFRIPLATSGSIAAGDYALNVTARGNSASIPVRDTIRVSIPPTPASVGVLFLRHGITTGNKDVPTADLRFRRNEHIRVEVPTVSSEAVRARLLDRTGRPLAVPVTAGLRDDADGARSW